MLVLRVLIGDLGVLRVGLRVVEVFVGGVIVCVVSWFLVMFVIFDLEDIFYRWFRLCIGSGVSVV